MLKVSHEKACDKINSDFGLGNSFPQFLHHELLSHD